MLTTYNCTFCAPRESTTGKCSVLVQYRCRDSISGVEPNVSVVGTVPLQPLQITHSHTHTHTHTHTHKHTHLHTSARIETDTHTHTHTHTYIIYIYTHTHTHTHTH